MKGREGSNGLTKKGADNSLWLGKKRKRHKNWGGAELGKDGRLERTATRNLGRDRRSFNKVAQSGKGKTGNTLTRGKQNERGSRMQGREDRAVCGWKERDLTRARIESKGRPKSPKKPAGSFALQRRERRKVFSGKRCKTRPWLEETSESKRRSADQTRHA